MGNIKYIACPLCSIKIPFIDSAIQRSYLPLKLDSHVREYHKIEFDSLVKNLVKEALKEEYSEEKHLKDLGKRLKLTVDEMKKGGWVINN